MKRNVYQDVTDRIVAQMEKGIIPWRQPWTLLGGAVSYATGKSYSMLNQFLLGREGEWLTYPQIQAQGGHINKGAKAGMVVFCKQVKITQKVTNEEGQEEERAISVPVLRSYNVFHINDCTGIESKQKKATEVPLQPVDKAEEIIQDYVQREGLQFVNGQPSDSAYYNKVLDRVVVPCMEQYTIVEEYYSTAFHELTHSTLKESRCNRESAHEMAAFGSTEYSREELVAEIGSAMLCGVAGLDCEKAFKNSVAYLQSWLKMLKGDNRAIVYAAAKAEKSTNYILNIKDNGNNGGNQED